MNYIELSVDFSPANVEEFKEIVDGPTIGRRVEAQRGWSHRKGRLPLDHALAVNNVDTPIYSSALWDSAPAGEDEVLSLICARPDQFVQVQSEDGEIGDLFVVHKQDWQHIDATAVVWTLDLDAKTQCGHATTNAGLLT